MSLADEVLISRYKDWKFQNVVKEWILSTVTTYVSNSPSWDLHELTYMLYLFFLKGIAPSTKFNT